MEQEETTVLEGQENAEGTPDVFGEGFDSDWGEPVFDDGQGGEAPVAVDFDMAQSLQDLQIIRSEPHAFP